MRAEGSPYVGVEVILCNGVGEVAGLAEERAVETSPGGHTRSGRHGEQGKKRKKNAENNYTIIAKVYTSSLLD